MLLGKVVVRWVINQYKYIFRLKIIYFDIYVMQAAINFRFEW